MNTFFLSFAIVLDFPRSLSNSLFQVGDHPVMILSVCRLSDVLLRSDLSAADRVQSGADERWKQFGRDNILALRSDTVLYRAAGGRQLQKVASVFSHKRGNEDTWPLALLPAGYA